MPVIEILNNHIQQDNTSLLYQAENEEGHMFFRGWTEITQKTTHNAAEQSLRSSSSSSIENVDAPCTVCHGQSSLTGDIFINTNVASLQYGSARCEYCATILDAVQTFNVDAGFDLDQTTISVLSADPHELGLRTLSFMFWKSNDVGRAEDQLAKVDIFRDAGT
jgi:hypothetical protein